MKTFIADIFPKVQRFSKKLDNITLLTNQHWVSIDNILNSKTVYIFRKNDELLISVNGQVERGTWEYLGNKSILINKSNQSFLFKHGFFDENILALRVDSKDEYAVFVNENKFDGDINSLEKVTQFLEFNYYKSKKESSSGHVSSPHETKVSSSKSPDNSSPPDVKESTDLNFFSQLFILLALAATLVILGLLNVL